MEEAIHGSVEYNPQYAPTTSHYKPTEYESQEERDSATVNLQPPEPQHADFDCPTDQEREPEHAHRPTAGDGVACGMKGPPDELYPHYHQHQCEQKSDYDETQAAPIDAGL